jgi:hypothetical protein
VHEHHLLDIVLDTIEMSCNQSKKELAKLKALVDDTVAKNTIDKHYFQVLAGKLCFATQVY